MAEGWNSCVSCGGLALCDLESRRSFFRWLEPTVPRFVVLTASSQHACACVSALRVPLFALVFAVAAKGPSVQALVKLAATLRLSLASGSLDGSSCSLTSAAHSAATPDRKRSALPTSSLLNSAVHRRLNEQRTASSAAFTLCIL